MEETRKDLVWIKRISFALALVFMGYFIIMTVIIPVSRFKIKFPEDSTGKSKVILPDLNWQETADDSVKNIAADLISREVFLLSRMEMTETDSISMTVSLRDSAVTLVVQGLTIYKAKIQSYSVSNAIIRTNPFVLAQWLSQPFIVESHFSSIPKAPVLYKKAPKDTIEAMSQPEIDPFKDDLDPVYFTLNLDRQLTLNFIQAEIPDEGFVRKLKVYKKEIRGIERKKIISSLVTFSPVEFVPRVNIVLDKKAARVIYRATPEHALVAIQL